MLRCWTLSFSLFYCANFLCLKGKCLSKTAAESASFLLSACLFVCAPFFINLDIVVPRMWLIILSWTYVHLQLLLFMSVYVTYTRRYEHTHTHTHARAVSRYPVFQSPVTLSSWYGLSDSSWFAWVSVVTAQRPAPGEPGLSAVCESWNRRWMAGSNLCPELCALLVPPAPLHHLNRSFCQQPEEPHLLLNPLLGFWETWELCKFGPSCEMWCRVTTCRWFFPHKPCRAVISSQKWSIQQKTSRSFICGQLLLLILIPALTTWIRRVNGEQRLRQIGCRSVRGLTGQTRYCLSSQRLKSVSWWNEVEKEKGDEDMRDRQHEGKWGLLLTASGSDGCGRTGAKVCDLSAS